MNVSTQPHNSKLHTLNGLSQKIMDLPLLINAINTTVIYHVSTANYQSLQFLSHIASYLHIALCN